MDNIVKVFSTPKWDVLQISFSEETRLLSKEVISHIGNIKLLGIELLRVKGECRDVHAPQASIISKDIRRL